MTVYNLVFFGLKLISHITIPIQGITTFKFSLAYYVVIFNVPFHLNEEFIYCVQDILGITFNKNIQELANREHGIPLVIL